MHDIDPLSQTRSSIERNEIDNSEAAERRAKEEAGVMKTLYAQPGLGRDNLRSKTACNARGLVEDLAHVETAVARLLKDRGKDINARTG